MHLDKPTAATYTRPVEKLTKIQLPVAILAIVFLAIEGYLRTRGKSLGGDLVALGAALLAGAAGVPRPSEVAQR